MPLNNVPAPNTPIRTDGPKRMIIGDRVSIVPDRPEPYPPYAKVMAERAKAAEKPPEPNA